MIVFAEELSYHDLIGMGGRAVKNLGGKNLSFLGVEKYACEKCAHAK